MCFYADYDWTASVSVARGTTASRDMRCDECRQPIREGQFVHHLYQQQYEECRYCEDEGCSCPEGDCCQCEKPDHGEECDWYCCENCWKFLMTVEAAEVAAGCRRSEALPPLYCAFEYIQENGIEEARKYFKLARRVYPELVTSGALGRLWREMFSKG